MNRKLVLIALLLCLPLPHIYRTWDAHARQKKYEIQRAAEEAASLAARRAVAPDLVPAPPVTPDFALKLYRAVAGAGKNKNVFISPAGVRWLLGMAYAGAGAATKEELAAVTGAPAQEQNLKDEAARMASLMAADPKVTLKVANGLWLKNGLPFKDGFIKSLREYFSAEVFARDFNESAVKEANDWVAKQTEGKISSIFKEFKTEDRALLVNAIYFKGAWTTPFQERYTSDEDFTLPSGRKEKRKLMYQSGLYDYYQGKDFQALRLPYGNRRLGMIVLLPSRALGLAGLNRRLTPDLWQTALSSMTEQRGSVYLPRFKLEYTAGLDGVLRSLGLKLPFDKNKADFGGMAEFKDPGERLYLSSVQQDTFVEVNEQGTEAAAVTRGAMGFACCAVKRPPPFEFRADRPFLYAITYRETGEILFIGALNDPVQR